MNAHKARMVLFMCLVMSLCGMPGCLVIQGFEACVEVENDCAEGNISGADRQDNDCDGVVDEGCPCDYKGNMSGVCTTGVISEFFQRCDVPRYYIEDEQGQCDNFDNDCDGQVDEGCACSVEGSSAGVCALGRLAGSNGQCTAPVLYAQNETSCDGYDNDCDGMVDEGCNKCDFNGLLVGVCRQGRQIMMNGGVVCAPPMNYVSDEDDCATDPFARDNADNDCDGEIDEGCACDFGGATGGVCSQGRLQRGQCSSPLGYELNETSCDGVDNDCDGFVDEGCDGGSK